MEIFKIIFIAITGVIAYQVLKSTKSPIAVYITIATGIVILIISLNSLTDVFITFNELMDKTNVSPKIYGTLLKIVGIAYITEYAISICDDLDCKSIGNKLAFASKISIFVLAIPIIKNLVDLILMLI